MVVAIRQQIDEAIQRVKLLAPQVADEIDKIDHLWACALMAVFTVEGANDDMTSHLKRRLHGSSRP